MTSKSKPTSLFDGSILRQAIGESFRKLSPRLVAKNPVMFVVEVGSALTTLLVIRDLIVRSPDHPPLWFTGAVSVWLWFTVIFANFAEAVAEGRGKAQAATLRKMRQDTKAIKLDGGREVEVSAATLRKGDKV